MAGNNGFDSDLLDDLDSGFTLEDDEESYGSALDIGESYSDEDDDNEYADLGNSSDDKKTVRKHALFTIGCGITLIILVFLVVGFINKLSNRETTSGEETPNKDNVVQQVQQGNSSQSNVSSQNNSTTSKNEWKEFDGGADIEFNEDYVESNFSITGIKHFVRVVDGDKIMVQSELTGAIAGFDGTFQITVPYYKGVKLNVGMAFKVYVQIGTYSGGKTVIGEIKY